MTLDLNISTTLTGRGRSFSLQANFRVKAPRVVLFGPSGSGKTLTLNILAGLATPDSGRIEMGEHVFFDSEMGINVAARQRRVGYLFQHYALFPHMDVRANVGFGLRPTWPGRLSSEDKWRVDELLHSFGIDQLARANPARLSGGQRQRVALARAIIGGPELLLLDEPFTALDSLLRARMRAELLAFHNTHPVPMVLITHDPADVAALAQIVVVYKSGCVTQILDLENAPDRTAALDALTARVEADADNAQTP